MTTPKVVSELLARSNRLGSEPRFTNYAGGNTSAKGVVANPATGKDTTVLWVKGSGGDLGTLKEAGLAALDLEKFKDLKNVVSGLCLEGDVKSKQINIVECNNNDSQKWTINNQEVKNALGLCLESDADNKVFLNDCLRTTFQKWTNNE